MKCCHKPMFKSQFGFAPIASAPPYEAPRGTQVSSSLVQTFLHSCTVHFHSLTQLILLLLTPCSFGQNKRAYHETVSHQTAKNSKIKGRGKNYNSMQLRRMGRNHCADIWTQVSMPPEWLWWVCSPKYTNPCLDILSMACWWSWQTETEQ